MTTTTDYRTEYAKNRADYCARTGVSKDVFNRRARQLATELADGEQVLPKHWYMASYQLD